MPLEIERRFLVPGPWPDHGVGRRFTQGWLVRESGVQVRVRHGDGVASVTCKIDLVESSGVPVRLELEEDVEGAVASSLLGRCFAVLDKTRRVVEVSGLRIDVDEYHGELAGLVIAEIELPDADAPVPRVAWLGREVTGDKRYGNLSLALRGRPSE